MNEEELAFNTTAQGLNSLNYLAELRKILRKLQRLISFPSIISLIFLKTTITYRFFKGTILDKLSKTQLYVALSIS